MTRHQAHLICKNRNCGLPIPLPLSTLHSTFERQPTWPKAEWTKIFLHPACRHIHQYGAEDVRWESFGTPEEADAPERVVYSILKECASNNCTVLVKVYSVLDTDKAPFSQLFGVWTVDAVKCPLRPHFVSSEPGNHTYEPVMDATWMD